MFEFFVGVLAGMLAVGSVWFWLVVLAAFITLTILVETENGAWATGTLAVTLLVANYLFKVPVIKGLIANPGAVATWLVIYFVVGAAWGLFKWYVYVHKQLACYKEVRAEFLKRNNATELTPALAAQLHAEIKNRYSYASKATATAPLASEHKGDIIRWMTYWPFSIIGTVLNDFVRKIWNHIYIFMAETYDRVSKHVFRNVTADAVMANAYAEEQKRLKEEADEKKRQEQESRFDRGYGGIRK